MQALASLPHSGEEEGRFSSHHVRGLQVGQALAMG